MRTPAQRGRARQARVQAARPAPPQGAGAVWGGGSKPARVPSTPSWRAEKARHARGREAEGAFGTPLLAQLLTGLTSKTPEPQRNGRAAYRL